MDIHEHGGEPVRALRDARDWLANVSRRELPSGDRVQRAYDAFLADLPISRRHSHSTPIAFRMSISSGSSPGGWWKRPPHRTPDPRQHECSEAVTSPPKSGCRLSVPLRGDLVIEDGMYRLSDDLARKRLFYPSPIISAPSVLVIDVPPLNRGTALPLGRYYPIILETDDERAELERFLAAPRREPVRPDIFDLRPSQLRSDNVLISRYDPPISGWP